MDNGYQVGYLDDGDFVEVGRFNNLDAVANSDLEIRHADSETRVVLGDDGFDFDGSDVAGVNALDVQSASVPQVTSNVDFDSNDVTGIGAIEAESVSTEEQDIGNETLIRAELTGGAQTIGVGGFENLEFDNIEKDERDEWNPSDNQFEPDKPGWYFIYAQARFDSGSDGDERRIRLESGGSTLAQNIEHNSATGDTIQIAAILRLDANSAVSVRVQNADSDDEIRADDWATYMNIRTVFREET